MSATLYYIHDPMCSWCWAFGPSLDVLISQLPPGVKVTRLLGGLAPDSDKPMSEAMQARLQQTWHRIEETVPGTRFNFDFWQRTTPRRSTYPACRALLAAREQGQETTMLKAIQEAYYRQARNPSDTSTLLQLAEEIGLELNAFRTALQSGRIEQLLQQEVAQAEALGVDSYPSLVLEVDGRHWPVPVDYLNSENMRANIEWMLDER